jgi:hypothetical protein
MVWSYLRNIYFWKEHRRRQKNIFRPFSNNWYRWFSHSNLLAETQKLCTWIYQKKQISVTQCAYTAVARRFSRSNLTDNNFSRFVLWKKKHIVRFISRHTFIVVPRSKYLYMYWWKHSGQRVYRLVSIIFFTRASLSLIQIEGENIHRISQHYQLLIYSQVVVKMLHIDHSHR